MLTPEAADVVNRGHDKDVAAVKAAPKSIDFMKDDAPFKTNFSIGDHKGDFQFYGVIDETFVDQNHGLHFDSALPNPSYSWNTTLNRSNPLVSNQSGFAGNGLQNSRVGIKGGIDLIGSTKLIFNLEEGFNPVTGEITNAAKALAQCSGKGATSFTNATAAQCGSLAADSSINGGLGNRQAYVGLEDSKLGKLVFGFINSPEKDILGSFDPVKSDTFSPLGESGKVGGGGGVSPDARLNNAFKYNGKYDTGMGVVNVVGAYQIGNDLGDTGGYASSAGIGYANKNWWDLDVESVYGYYEDTYKAGVGSATVTNVIALTEMNVHTNAFVAKIQPLSYLKVSGGYSWYMDSAPTDKNITASSSTFTANAWGYGASVVAQGSAVKYSIGFAGGELNIGELYPALEGLKLQAGFYDYTANKTLSTEYDVYTTSLVLDYKINKRFDTYAAFTNNKWVGPGSTNTDANYFTDIRAYGVGLRMAF